MATFAFNPNTLPAADQALDIILGDTKKPVQSVPAPSLEITDATDLVSKTAFLSVQFGVMGNTRKVSGATVLTTDADKSLLRVSKTLLTSKELEAIRSADGKMRAYLYNTCLPWDMGMMMLPKPLVATAHERMSAYKLEREVLVDEFIAAYPKLIEEAVAHLGSLYNPNDYLAASEAKAKFYFSWNWVQFGVADSLKSISMDLYESEKQKAAAQVKSALDEITNVMREKLLDLVTNLEDRLAPNDEGKAKVLRETPVTKLQEFLTTFEQYNVTGDVDLAKLVAQARELVGGTSAQSLRSSDEWREKVRKGMEGIKDQLATMVEDKPGRKFREED